MEKDDNWWIVLEIHPHQFLIMQCIQKLIICSSSFSIMISMYLCLSPSVTVEVYCFPRRQLIFSFGRRVIYHSKGLWEYIPKSIQSVGLSVCSTTFKRIAGIRFYPKSLLLYINEFVSTSTSNKWKAFFKFVFKILTENRTIINTNSKTWILIKLKCVLYQIIPLNKLYKLMDFFQISNSFSN